MGRWLLLPRKLIPAEAVLAPFAINECSPSILNQNASGVQVTVYGTGFIDGVVAEVSGTGITVNSCTFVSETEATLDLDIASDAPLDSRTLTLTNTFTLQATLSAAFAVEIGTTAMTAANRTSAAAPAPVHFGLTGAGSVDQPTADWSQEYDVRWNFADLGSGTWVGDGTSKNAAIGQTAAHVFETPGTYVVTARTIKADGTVKTYSESITVTDPDVVYAAATQYYDSDAADDTGAGTIGDPKKTWGDAMTYVWGGNTRRVLFKKGGTYTPAAGAVTTAARTGTHIGSYGTGADPIVAAACNTGTTWMGLVGTTDVRVVGLNIQNSGTGGLGIECGDYTLVSTCTLNAFEQTVIAPSSGNDDVCVFASTLSNNSQVGVPAYFVYTGAQDRIAILGCTTTGMVSATSATIRLHSSEAVVQGNDFGTSAGTVKMVTPTTGAASRDCVFINNYVHNTAAEPMWVGNQGGVDFLYNNVLVEANRFASTAGYIVLVQASQYVTIRNNTFDTAGTCVRLEAHTGDGQDKVYIDNCSAYSGAGATPTLVDNVDGTNVFIRNCATKKSTGSFTLSTGTVTATTNLSVATDPLFTDPAAGDFNLQAGSPCRGAGTDSLTRYDKVGVSRDGGDGTDQGAFEYDLP